MKQTLYAWASIVVGCTILAAGFVFFINPYNIVPGGVYGASIVLHNLFPSIQVGTFGYMFDIPLLILSVLLLGAKLGIRTIVAALLTPLLMNTMSRLVYPTREALESLDPAQLLGGSMNMTDHLMLTCIIGAVVIGVGTAIVIRSQATTGGSDIVGMLLQKYAHIRFSRAILLVDGAVVCFGLVVIGFGLGTASDSTQPSWLLVKSLQLMIAPATGYIFCIFLFDHDLVFFCIINNTYPGLSLIDGNLISIFIISRVIAYMINGAKNDKLIFVISDHELQALHQYILKDLDRTATCIKSSGLYTGKDKEMIFLVVSYQEVQGVKLKIKEADPRAFVVVTDAYDTFGEGWKQLPSPHEIYPE